MHLPKILTPLAAAAVLAAAAAPAALAQSAAALSSVAPAAAASRSAATAAASGDEVLRDMQQAFKRGDRDRLAQLLPAARNHPLEPWAAYWELRARLEEAQPEEVQVFLQRWAGTYQEDRLRNDWLRLLGQRRDWARFADLHPAFRMGDDREVGCYAATIDFLRGALPASGVQEVVNHWQAQRDADDGCTHAAGELFSARQLPALEVWRKARLSAEANRQRATRDAVAIAAPDVSNLVADLYANPAKFLGSRVAAPTRQRQELVVLALIRLAAKDPDNAAALLEGKWGVQLTAEERQRADQQVAIAPAAAENRYRAIATALKVDQAIYDMTDLRIHDLRRTLGSWQAKTGASLAIIGKSLNHKTHQATAIYARLDLDPVRQSVNTATQAMLEAAGVKPPANVVPIKRKP